MIVDPVLRLINAAYPGSFLRGESAFLLWGGEGDQPSHCDYMRPRGSSVVLHGDSMSAFICVGTGGRWFGVQGPGGVERVWLRPGDVMFVSAGAFHCGLENAAEGSEVVFFYVDRHTSFSSLDGRGKVGALWGGLSPGEQARHLVTLHFSAGPQGIPDVLRRLFRLPPPRPGRPVRSVAG